MYNLNRRAFITTSASTLALLHVPTSVSAVAAECASSYVPSRLTVDCASRKNFALFRQNPDYLGLAAVVSITAVTGSLGKYPAANLFLFPWLKPPGVKLGTAKAWGALAPTGPTTSTPMNPIPNAAPIMPNAFARFSGGVVSAMYAKAVETLAAVAPAMIRPTNSHEIDGASAIRM